MDIFLFILKFSYIIIREIVIYKNITLFKEYLCYHSMERKLNIYSFYTNTKVKVK